MFRRSITGLATICGALLHVACGSQSTENDAVIGGSTLDSLIVTRYEVDDSLFPNPERGFYRYADLPGLSADIGAIREQEGITLVWGRISMAAYRQDELLPNDFLARVEQGFQTARDQGMKVIVRGTYGFEGPGGDYTSYTDPPIHNIRRHVTQLGPIFTANADVIALFEAGFIGPWGEFHTTAIATDPEQSRDFVHFLLEQTPEERMIALRYPLLKQRIFASGGGFETVTDANAYSGEPVARVGHHNDCFLSSANDVGTYDRGGMDRAGETAYLTGETALTVFGGESCAAYELNDCEPARTELHALHATYLNSQWHPDVLEKWESQGCLDYVRRRLGARFALHESQFPVRARAGGRLRVALDLENYGFASLYNSRNVEIVLQHAATGRSWSLATGLDPRAWKPGERYLMEIELPLPRELESGTYTAYLHLADPATSLRDDGRYAYRLASLGVWNEKTGWNRLAQGILIEAAPEGKTRPDGSV
ncbi:MAG: hypothetical protein CME04_23515 [Gemmatimonadaceae bacterium]|nr:hypothetical protein [Gemmatimonadaceae bacterium]